jgi:hypothetical protein
MGWSLLIVELRWQEGGRATVGGVHCRMYQVGGVAAGRMVHCTDAASLPVIGVTRLVGGLCINYSFVSVRHPMADCLKVLLWDELIRSASNGFGYDRKNFRICLQAHKMLGSYNKIFLTQTTILYSTNTESFLYSDWATRRTELGRGKKF